MSPLYYWDSGLFLDASSEVVHRWEDLAPAIGGGKVTGGNSHVCGTA